MKTDEEVSLPNFKYYYWAAQLKPIESWLKINTDTHWLNREKAPSTAPDFTSLCYILIVTIL